MKVSIITATFNSSESILNCLQSVNSQTYIDLEHIIIDGNSSDNTLAIIKSSHSNRIGRIISEQDSGPYKALNKGIDLASGEIIGFLHSDDSFASPNVIAEIMKLFNETEADVIYGNLEYVTKGSINKVVRTWQSRSFSPEILNQGWMPPHPTVFMKKVVYEKHGLFNLNYKISADYDYMLRVFKDRSLKFHYLPKLITKMKTGGLSNRSLINIIKKSIEDYRIISNHSIGNPLKGLLLKNFSKIKQFWISIN